MILACIWVFKLPHLSLSGMVWVKFPHPALSGIVRGQDGRPEVDGGVSTRELPENTDWPRCDSETNMWYKNISK